MRRMLGVLAMVALLLGMVPGANAREETCPADAPAEWLSVKHQTDDVILESLMFVGAEDLGLPDESTPRTRADVGRTWISLVDSWDQVDAEGREEIEFAGWMLARAAVDQFSSALDGDELARMTFGLAIESYQLAKSRFIEHTLKCPGLSY